MNSRRQVNQEDQAYDIYEASKSRGLDLYLQKQVNKEDQAFELQKVSKSRRLGL